LPLCKREPGKVNEAAPAAGEKGSVYPAGEPAGLAESHYAGEVRMARGVMKRGQVFA